MRTKLHRSRERTVGARCSPSIVSFSHVFTIVSLSCALQLRQLEERLLDTISAVEGTILDDDTVVKALEDLKGEAGDVAKEVRRENSQGPPLLSLR